MNLGNLVVLVIVVAVIGLVAYLAMSQASIPERMRRLFKQKLDDRRGEEEEPRLGPRPNPMWDADPDQTNEAQQIERVTGVIRNGEPFTIVSGDPSYWGSSNFEIEGLVVGVAEAETVDAGGNFQFRYCLIEAPGTTANTLIVEGDAPTASVAYLGRAYGPDETVGDMRVGAVISKLQEERRRYREQGMAELPIDLPPYEGTTLVAARYEGRLALLESEPGKGYLPVSAANREGVRYSDLSVRLDSSGWIVRLVEVGAYSYLLELEPIRLGDLTVHHLA